MGVRLQVILEDQEMREIQRIARQNHLSVAKWVRQTLRAACRKVPGKDTRRKLDCLRAATRHTFPAGDVRRMLREIERGCLDDPKRGG